MAATGGGDENSSMHFFVHCDGQIKSADFGADDDLYCRYSFSLGHDWLISSGIESGLSQISKRSSYLNGNIVWNFPIDITFQSTNVHGWPRMAVTVYGIDFLGRDVVKGYGSILIPLSPGSHEINLPMYAPLAVSTFNQWMSWWMGNPPEFYDSKFVCEGEGREVTRVRKTGMVSIKLNILTKGLSNAGYSFTSDGNNNNMR